MKTLLKILTIFIAIGPDDAIHYGLKVMGDKGMKRLVIIILSILFFMPSFAQVGRYELRRTNHIGTYQIFDTSSGHYTTVKWAPTNKNGDKVGIDIDSLVSNTAESLKRFFKELELDLEGI